jgi:hypothetical protein
MNLLKRWRDGMGRVTVRCEEVSSHAKGAPVTVQGVFGVVRQPGWLQIYGPCTMQTGYRPTAEERRAHRERVAERARYRRRQRHGPRAERSRGYGPPLDVEPWELTEFQ